MGNPKIGMPLLCRTESESRNDLDLEFVPVVGQ